MSVVKVTVDARGTLKHLQDVRQKQIRFATVVALTRTAQDVRTELRKEMTRVFDRPTRFTLNSLYVKPATKQDLEARVWVKDSEKAHHYLLPQIEGGSRWQKRFEQILHKAGILAANERTVPGAGAKLDAYGNMSRGQIVQIVSQLKAFNQAGSSMNATNSKRSRSRRANVEYFYSRKGESRVGRRSWKGGTKVQHLPTGIWARYRFAMGTAVKPVLLFVKRTSYSSRFKFFDVAERVIDRNFAVHFDRELAKALRTAR